MSDQNLGKRKRKRGDNSDDSNERKLQNMKNIKKALDIEAKNAKDNFLQEGISGLKKQRYYWNSSKAVRDQEDNIARAELESVGAETYNPKRQIRLTHKNANKGGKSKKNRSNKNKKSRRSK